MTTGKPLVLVVDDDPDLRETVADGLDMEGYRVMTADNGATALERLHAAEELPSIILLDMMMPIMDGWTFCAEKNKSPKLARIPVIIFTAHVSAQEAAEAVHAASFLKKPLRFEQLVEAVSRYAT